MGMSYKLSERKQQHLQYVRRLRDMDVEEDSVDWGKVASVFMVIGVLSLLTAWIYSFDTNQVLNVPINHQQILHPEKAVFGPINVAKYHETYTITIKASMTSQSWAFVSGQVLDRNKHYLFSFGKGLWDEEGRDSDGYWHETDNTYSMLVTFPEPGKYYFKLEYEYNKAPRVMTLQVSKQLGSSIPHFWLGIFLLMIGVVLNELQNRSILRAINDIEWE